MLTNSVSFGCVFTGSAHAASNNLKLALHKLRKPLPPTDYPATFTIASEIASQGHLQQFLRVTLLPIVVREGERLDETISDKAGLQRSHVRLLVNRKLHWYNVVFRSKHTLFNAHCTLTL